MRNTWMLLAIATFCVLALTAIRVGAQSVQPTSETYSWSGELVSVRCERSHHHGQIAGRRRPGARRAATVQIGRPDRPDLVWV